MSRRFDVVIAVGAVLFGCSTAPRSRPAGPDAAGAAAAAEASAAPRSTVLARAEEELAAGRLARAEALFDEAALASPYDPAVHAGLARVALANAKVKAAIGHADRALELGAGPATLVLRGRAHAFARRLDDAARDLEAALERSPDDLEAWASLAAVQVARGDAHEARRAFGEVKRRAGEAAAIDRAWTQMVGIRADPVQPQEALDRCARGHAAALAGRWVDAQHEYVNGLKRAGRYEWCGAALAYAQARTGNRAGAEGGLRRLIEVHDRSKPELRADARGLLAEVLLASGKPADAAAEARAALAVRPGRVALLETLAQACDRAGDPACARDAYARLLSRPNLSAEQRAAAESRVAALGPAVTPAAAAP